MRALPLLLALALAGCAQSHTTTDPTDPVEPSDPSDPTDPTDPVDPTDPGHLTPPPISGGHMIVLGDGSTAVVADPDRDRLHIFDLTGESASTVLLTPGDEPGRLVEDGAGRVHVALRSGGAVVSLNPTTFAVDRRRAVCPNPRGIAHDPSADEILVACAGGQLFRMGAAGGAPTATFIEHDLRDVLISGDRTYVSTFRSAELLEVGESGIVARRSPGIDEHPMETLEGGLLGTFLPNVAWRTRPDGDGGAYMLHQMSMQETVNVSMEGYSLADLQCQTGLVAISLTHFPAEGPPETRRFQNSGVAVDFDIRDGMFVVAMPSELTETGDARPGIIVPQPGSVIMPVSQFEDEDSPCLHPEARLFANHQVTSVAVLGPNSVIGWDRLGARLRRSNGFGTELTGIEVGGQPSVEDPGHELFHVGTFAQMACATCHPEGREDGHTWDFSAVVRRTQTLTGGILGTEPFHWSGDQADMRAIMDETFTRRMSAPILEDGEITEIGTWLDTLPEVAAPARDPEAAERGEAAFVSEGCVDCHAGPRFTNSETVDVGTGGAFQVPSLLGLAVRGPWMHTGCADSLAEVLDGCGGTPHGDVADAGTRADLVAYLESL
jgi:hypothetical protein